MGYSRRFLTPAVIIRAGTSWALFVHQNRPASFRKETHPDDIKALFTYRPPPSPSPSVQLGSGVFFALGRRGNRLISGCLIPSLCARMTCKEWNPQEHLGSAPWQRIAISAQSASSRSFCVRDREEWIARKRNRAHPAIKVIVKCTRDFHTLLHRVHKSPGAGGMEGRLLRDRM